MKKKKKIRQIYVINDNFIFHFTGGSKLRQE